MFLSYTAFWDLSLGQEYSCFMSCLVESLFSWLLLLDDEPLMSHLFLNSA